MWTVTEQQKPLPHAIGLPGDRVTIPHRNCPQAALAAEGFIVKRKRIIPGFKGTEAQRFFRKVEITPGGCWLWTGSKNPRGYGAFCLQAKPGMGENVSRVCAHRWVFQWWFGNVETGIDVHHTCENPSCVNPLHLKAVPHKQHIQNHWRQKPWKQGLGNRPAL